MATRKNSNINGSEYYRIRRKIGEKIDKDGNLKPVMKSFYGSSRRDAEHMFDEWKDRQREEQETRKDRIGRSTFGEMAAFYHDNVLLYDSRLELSTRKRYSSSYTVYVKDCGLSDILIKDLTAMDIQKWYNSLPVTESTMKAIHKFMASLFKWMNLNGYCSYMLQGIALPSKPDKNTGEVVIWDDDDLNKILSNLGRHRLRFFVILAAFTGMRIGELMAVKYSDFDLVHSVLHVERQFYDGEIKAPKCNSKRLVPIHHTVAEELMIHKSWHEREMKRRHYKTEYVFTTSGGMPLDDRNIRRSLKRYYESIGVEYVKFHAYRATFCTNLCRAGVPIQVAGAILGHKSVDVTAKYYTSIDMGEKIGAVERLTFRQELSG